MTCFGDSTDERTKAIDKELAESKKKMRFEKVILLLGAGESGKSTIYKQMRIIHGEGYNDTDKKNFIPIIESNIIMSIRTLCTEAVNAKENAVQDLAEERDTMINVDLELYEEGEADGEFIKVAPMIKKLWAHAEIQDTYKRRAEFQLTDSCEYFMDAIDRVIADGYLPNMEDILRSRVQTKGVGEYAFKVQDQSNPSKNVYRMIDVGGQRAERRKWICCFDGITSILFITAISAFNQVLQEDSETNRLAESLELFRTILQMPYFKETSIIIFFNKIDLLEKKVKEVSIKDYFEDFDGDSTNVDEVRGFIEKKFIQDNEFANNRHPKIFSHVTNATDTDLVKHIFRDVHQTILDHLLGSFGFN